MRGVENNSPKPGFFIAGMLFVIIMMIMMILMKMILDSDDVYLYENDQLNNHKGALQLTISLIYKSL